MTSRAARRRAAALLAAAGAAVRRLLPAPAPGRQPGPPASTPARPRRHGQPPASGGTRRCRWPRCCRSPPPGCRPPPPSPARFTAAWDSWSWRQSPAAWLAALQPMAAASLEPALAQAAGTRGVLAQRAAARQAAAATVTALAIRDLTPGSVTVTVTAAQVITGSSGTSRALGHLRGHPHPGRHRLAGVGHRARRRGQLLKEAPPDASPGRRARLGHRHPRRRRRAAAPAARGASPARSRASPGRKPPPAPPSPPPAAPPPPSPRATSPTSRQREPGTASRGPSWPPSAKSKAATAPTTGRPAPAPSARCSSCRRPGRSTATAGTS